jgi:parallel beta-helix repeat protein
VRHAEIDTGGGDWSIEVLNSSRTLVTSNQIRHFGIGIGVEGVYGYEGSLPSIGNRVENNVLREGSLESSGVFVAEVDSGTVRETTVAHNTAREALEDGIFVSAAKSSDGLGTPPFEELTGVGPSQTVIEDNVVTNNTPDGIYLHAPENLVKGNRANRNTEWGIDAIEGTIDGGGNTAHGNGQPAQCRGVVCNGHATGAAVLSPAPSAGHRLPAVRGDRPLRGSR